jgi:hypothetical protein
MSDDNHQTKKSILTRLYTATRMIANSTIAITALVASLVAIGVLRSCDYRSEGWPDEAFASMIGSWCSDAYAPYYPNVKMTLVRDGDELLFEQVGYGPDVDHGPTTVVPVTIGSRYYIRYPESAASLTSLQVSERFLYRERWKAAPNDEWIPATSDGADRYKRC